MRFKLPSPKKVMKDPLGGGFGRQGDDSDRLDILGLGLDARRDVRAGLGMEAADLINDAMKQYGLDVEAATKLIEGGYGQAIEGYQPFVEGATAEGYNRNIADLLQGQGTQALINERSGAMSDYLTSQGLGRSSYGMEEMGNIPIETVMGLEQMLSGRQLQGAQGVGGLQTERAVNISDLLTGRGSAGVGAAQTIGQTRAQGVANAGNLLGDVFGGMFCDERLKKNKKPIGKIGDITIYSYEANEEGERVGMNTMFGPMAQEVQEKYPDLVFEDKGYLKVKMGELIKRAA